MFVGGCQCSFSLLHGIPVCGIAIIIIIIVDINA